MIKIGRTETWNWLIGVLLVMILLLQPFLLQAEPAYGSDGPGGMTDGSNLTEYTPNIVIGTQGLTPTFEAGKDIRLLIPLYNAGRGEARDIVVTLQIEDAAEFPFVLEGHNYRKTVPSIDGRRNGVAIFLLKVRSNVPEGIYSLPFTVEYASRDLSNRYSYNESFFIRINSNLKAPRLVIEEVNYPQGALNAGASSTIQLDLRNEGDLAIKDIQLTLSGFGTNGIFMDDSNHTRSLKSLQAGERGKLYFPLRVEAGAEEGTFPLQLDMTYQDQYGTRYEKKEELYLPIKSSRQTSGQVIIEELQVPGTAVEPFTDFTVSLKVRNISSGKLEDLLVKADGGEDLLPKSPALQQVASLGPGEAREISFIFFARDGLKTQNYPLQVRVESLRPGKSEEPVIQYAGVLVGDDRGNGVPKIIVNNYDYGGGFIEAGKSFPLSISFYNTNTRQSVRNIRISLTSEGEVFSPVGSSNTFYIPEIAPGGRVEKQIRLRSRPDAGYKVHNLYADIEYEDESGEPHQGKEIIGIPLVQESRLVFSEVETGSEAMVGNPLPISLEFYNAGRGKIRNLVVTLEGDFEKLDGALYIGNMDPGASNYFDATLIPAQPGTLAGTIVFRYDDEIDEQHTVEKSFSFNVVEMAVPPEDFGEAPPPESNIPRWVYWAGGLLLALVLVGSAVFYYRKRKQRDREREDDE